MKKRWMMDLEKSMPKQVKFEKGAPNTQCFCFSSLLNLIYFFSKNHFVCFP